MDRTEFETENAFYDQLISHYTVMPYFRPISQVDERDSRHHCANIYNLEALPPEEVKHKHDKCQSVSLSGEIKVNMKMVGGES